MAGIAVALQCQMLVQMYLPGIIDFLDDKEPPEVVCQQLHLCPQNQTVVQPPPVAARP